MVMVGSTQTTSLDNTWKPPKVAVRTVRLNDIRSNSSTGRVGDIRHELVPLEYTSAPGPEGGSMSLAWRGQYFIKAGQRWDDVEKWSGYYFTLEERKNEGNRALQNVLFRGRRSALSLDFDTSANSIGPVIRDYWYDASFPPCRFPTQGKTVGQICQILKDSYYYEPYLTSGGSVSHRPRYLEQRIFPLDSNNEPWAEIDEELLNSTIRPGTVYASGQGFASFFADLIQKAYGGSRVPDIDYDKTGKIRLVARRLGTRERTLVIGSPGATPSQSRTQLAKVQSLKGTIDYSGIKNRGVGYGAPVRQIKPMVLTPGWTEAKESAVKDDPDIRDQPGYRHVYRRFKAPDRFWHIAASPHGFADSLRDTMKFSRSYSVPGESTSDWTEFDSDFEIIRERTDNEEGGTVIDDLSSIKPGDYKDLAIQFISPQVREYYTSAQIALGEAGSSRGDRTLTAYDITVEAAVIGDPLTVDTGVIGDDSEGVRTVVFDNPNAQKIVHYGHYEISEDGSRSDLIETPTTGMVRDDSGFFLSQANDYVTEATKAAKDMYAGIAVFEPDWIIGDRIVRIINNIGQIVFDGIEWDLMRIPHQLHQGGISGWRTDLSLSDVARGGFYAL